MKKSAKTATRRPERNPSTRKQQLLDAALNLFAEFGYHGVAVPMIAQAAGTSTGTIYTYFESKDALVNELFWMWKQALKAHYLIGYPIHAPTQEQFYFIWDRLHSYTDSHPQAFQFLEGQLHASYLADRCRQLEEEVFEIGREFVRAGQKAGVVKAAAPQVIVSFFFGAFVQYFKDSRAKRMVWSEAHSKEVRDLCWTAIAQ